MSDPVRVDKASLDALTESMRAQSIALDAAHERIAELETKVAELRALLARASSLSERMNDPAQDGVGVEG